MTKRPYQPNGPQYPLNSSAAWSIGSNGLTRTGQAELLRHLGRQLQTDYQSVLREPPPERIKQLMERIKAHGSSDDEDV